MFLDVADIQVKRYYWLLCISLLDSRRLVSVLLGIWVLGHILGTAWKCL